VISHVVCGGDVNVVYLKILTVICLHYCERHEELSNLSPEAKINIELTWAISINNGRATACKYGTSA
jgi:hypothetical protein